MNEHNHQKKIAAINDLSGFGRCSLVVSLPIISHLKIQCCPLPTSVLSNHTGFDSFHFVDFTSHMESVMDEWQKLGLTFSGITTGFLGSADQIRIVRDFLERFDSDKTIVIIDPVMGDYGKAYSTYTEEMCQGMKELVSYADILTPNLTEACILTDTPYQEKWHISDVVKMAETLSKQGPAKVVITGVPQGTFLCNLCYEKGTEPQVVKTQKVGTQRSGTGDIFAAIIAADAVNGIPFKDSVSRAAHFIKKCIRRSIELDIPLTDGVCFEEVLSSLK